MTKVMVGLSTGEMARRADFYDSYNMMDKPEGSVLIASHGQSPAQNRNIIIREGLKHKCSHILFIDDDMVLPANLLTGLLKHKVPIVTGLYLGRTYPHYPVIFDKAYTSGKCKYTFLTPDNVGLKQIVNCGFGCVLIHISVFHKLQDPWVTLGEIEKDGWCDDVVFFNKVRHAGIPIYCDFDMLVGHSLNVTLVPQRIGGKWQVSYITQTGHAISYNPTIPTENDIDKEEKQDIVEVV
jgi:hypothetical protein